MIPHPRPDVHAFDASRIQAPRPGKRFHAFCTFPVGEKDKRSLEFQRFHNVFLYRRTADHATLISPHQYYSLNQ